MKTLQEFVHSSSCFPGGLTEQLQAHLYHLQCQFWRINYLLDPPSLWCKVITSGARCFSFELSWSSVDIKKSDCFDAALGLGQKPAAAAAAASCSAVKMKLSEVQQWHLFFFFTFFFLNILHFTEYLQFETQFEILLSGILRTARKGSNI